VVTFFQPCIPRGEWHGRVTVTFGTPLSLKGQDYPGLAKQVEEAVKAL
jgi:hypothetical protein